MLFSDELVNLKKLKHGQATGAGNPIDMGDFHGFFFFTMIEF